ncbi:DbpA RNA binding domain-containing protein [Escherichia coli]
MQLYRIEVGRDDGVEVRHIVGAIANEGDISSRYIGNIKLFASHSTIDNCRKVCRVKCCNTLRVLAFSTSR